MSAQEHSCKTLEATFSSRDALEQDARNEMSAQERSCVTFEAILSAQVALEQDAIDEMRREDGEELLKEIEAFEKASAASPSPQPSPPSTVRPKDQQSAPHADRGERGAGGASRREKAGNGTETERQVLFVYANDDAIAVHELRDEIVRRGHSVWWDQDILPGENRRAAVRKAVQRSYAVVLFLSSALERLERDGFYTDLRTAMDELSKVAPGRIYLVPVRLDECGVPDLEELQEIEAENYFPVERRPQALERVVQALERARS